ncbi:hypothetical protein [Streptomyces poonensis]|uniref:Membrane protein n=1 Tax=Streptomyces poonensis TaxID=68255 RepID=A0A918Q2V7_9ACTN|nr:hypothetical protein [Streptomyces poonensis]GGZ31982.1 membrane protein [Streptomyces poonensis]GLJ93389.1 membrane protein [Streptomyces poonensis]
MIRATRVLPTLTLLPLLLLTACGDKQAVTGDPELAPPASPGAGLRERAEALGIAPEHVYLTEAPGFTLAEQSVGVSGDDGFSAVYWSKEKGAQLQLRVERGTVTAANCPEQQVGEGTGPRATCERDGDAWYRTAGAQHEYAVPEDGHVVRVGGDTATVDRDVLRAAAEAVRRPTDEEAARILPSPAAGEPVERGDLPPEGDGAPNNDVGVGG